MKVSRIGTFPYLDPSPGYGTRPRGAGHRRARPCAVCWNVRFAGARRCRSTCCEDQNGRVGDRPHDRRGPAGQGLLLDPTAGFEPGRHWVYGVVHNRHGVPVSARYWPIAIEVADPAALPAPADLAVTPTADGAERQLRRRCAGANLYVIRAEPAERGRGGPGRGAGRLRRGRPRSSLRGAASWNVSVQAADATAGRQPRPRPVTVTPSAGVVVAGTPERPGRGSASRGRSGSRPRTSRASAWSRARAARGLSRDGLLRWTPRGAKGVAFAVEGCSADARCVTRELKVTPIAAGRVPFGPIRGFHVLQSVVRPRQQVTLIAQGVRGRVRVEVDGRRVRARRLDSGSVRARLPARLAKRRPRRLFAAHRRQPRGGRPARAIVVRSRIPHRPVGSTVQCGLWGRVAPRWGPRNACSVVENESDFGCYAAVPRGGAVGLS